MDYEKIFYLNEGQYKSTNYEYLELFVNTFIKETKLNINEIKLIYGVSDYEELFLSLKDYVYKKYPIYIYLFYELLEESKFLMFHDLIDSMYVLGASTYQTIDFSKRDTILLSPDIKSVGYSQGKIKIYSEQFGEYSFWSIYDYFNDLVLQDYIRKNNDCFSGNCHNVSWEFLNLLENGNLVTELLPFYYEGTFYHSVIHDVNDMFIDLANEIVYDEKVRKDLFQGQIVCETKKEDLENNLIIAKECSINPCIEKKYNNSLILALHKQATNKR